ncbi:class I SAM-dependent methyltransferase [Candidatus Peregrinibacteria bacterium]|nr:class I SAM-dependent methyltransferase [Candidatus Peregrinibacteria bacterium]
MPHLKKNTGGEILKHVKKDYSLIAQEFNRTRQAAWPEFSAFWRAIQRWNKKNVVKKLKFLDAGCGNGRLFAFFSPENIGYIGLDNNSELLKIACKKYPGATFKLGEVQRLPFPPRSFDVVFCIAVFHHLPTQELRRKTLKEFRRVLLKGGLLAITVWNLHQKKYKKFIQKETRCAWIPWGNTKSVRRFYYAFLPDELKTLLQESGFSSIQKLPSRYNFAYLAVNS